MHKDKHIDGILQTCDNIYEPICNFNLMYQAYRPTYTAAGLAAALGRSSATVTFEEE